MSLNKFKAEMYSTEKLPDELRSTLEFAADPYSDDAAGAATLEYLKSLGVFFYRDEFHGAGLLIQPDEEKLQPIEEASGFLGYKQLLMLETDDKTFIRISAWDKPSPKIIAKNGDDRAWMEFNKAYNIVSITPTRITLS